MTVTKEDLLELKNELHKEITETGKQASKEAEQRRNEALKVFAGLGVVLPILGYFGLTGIVSSQIEKIGAETLVAEAQLSALSAKEHEIEAKQTAGTLASLLESYQSKGLIQECRICFQESEGSSQCQGTPKFM